MFHQAPMAFWDCLAIEATHAQMPALLDFTSNKHALSFQAYLDNIQAKTGKTPTDFRNMAEEKGCATAHGLCAGVKADDIVAWLKQDFGLDHGHAMALVALLKRLKNKDQ